jgi:hypothetical protein
MAPFSTPHISPVPTNRFAARFGSQTAAATPSNNNTSNNNTPAMSAAPSSRPRKAPPAQYRPPIITTVGARPACLVNASVTYVGDGQIYAFGGFDQYTDEVYNHVLRLNMHTKQWSLVDNYGDIPGVRMGQYSPPINVVSLSLLLTCSRPHGKPLAGTQAARLWRRERTSILPV